MKDDNFRNEIIHSNFHPKREPILLPLLLQTSIYSEGNTYQHITVLSYSIKHSSRHVSVLRLYGKLTSSKLQRTL